MVKTGIIYLKQEKQKSAFSFKTRRDKQDKAVSWSNDDRLQVPGQYYGHDQSHIYSYLYA